MNTTEKDQFNDLMSKVQEISFKSLIDTCYKGDPQKIVEVFNANIKDFEASRRDKDVKNTLSSLVIAGITGDALLSRKIVNLEEMTDVLVKNTSLFDEKKDLNNDDTRTNQTN